jgi:hypothetical protein
MLAIATLSSACLAQNIYRWTDKEGKIHYSDQPPIEDVKVQQRKLGGNFIQTDELPYATQVAMKRFPATLWVTDCGDVCANARKLLRERGVPVTEINPAASQAAVDKLKALTGTLEVPVLQLGDLAPLKGFNEERWQAALSSAGYPTVALTTAQKKNLEARSQVVQTPTTPAASAASAAPVPGSTQAGVATAQAAAAPASDTARK